MKESSENNTDRNFQTVAITRDGKEIPVSLSGALLKNAEGEIQGYAGVFRDITRLKQLEHSVKHLTEMEREKLRCNLHDSTSQLLAAAQYLTTSLTQRLLTMHPEAEASLAEIARIVGDAQASIRDVTEGLRPLPAEPDALASALRGLADLTNDRHGILCRFTSCEPVLIENIDAAAQLYLIAQEAVANAIEHAKAGTIEVSISERDGMVRLVVRDDGVGFSAGELNNGMGVGIMRSRSEKIGASFHVGHGETSGTVVTCIWNKTMPHG